MYEAIIVPKYNEYKAHLELKQELEKKGRLRKK